MSKRRKAPLDLWSRQLHWETPKRDIHLFRKEAFRRRQIKEASIVIISRTLYIEDPQKTIREIRGFIISFESLSSLTSKPIEGRDRVIGRKIINGYLPRRWIHSAYLERPSGREITRHYRTRSKWTYFCPWWDAVNHWVWDICWFEKNEFSLV